MTVIVDTSHSPHTRLRPVPISAVRLTDTFWAPRLKINHEVTVPSQHRHLEETGCLDNFRRAAGRDLPFRGMQFADSDAYKWLEAAVSVLASHPDDAALRVLVDDVAGAIEAAQQPDGYLDTYFLFDKADERWTTIKTGFNNMHELYCAGHFFQAAVAHHRATGSDRMLRVATRLADHICDTFGPGDGWRQGADGHPEVEMALVELFRETGNRRFLTQAQYFLDVRLGQGHINDAQQSDVPFRDLTRIEAHAVCAVYLAAGATDISAETGDETLRAALDRLWANMTGRQMYLTGGIGSRWQWESFGNDFELPARAYAETCAAIGSVMWNWRMLGVTGEARYADVLEMTLYNGLLSGLSLDGREYFYQNPLADDGTHRRQPWFGCACCPPNVARLLAQLPGYFYSVAEGSVWVHLYAANEASLTLPDGGTVRLTQATDYPWDSDITITVGDAPEEFTSLHLRVPDWAMGAAITVNGAAADVDVRPGSYAVVAREWQAGDVVRLVLPMPARMLVGHPRVADTVGPYRPPARPAGLLRGAGGQPGRGRARPARSIGRRAGHTLRAGPAGRRHDAFFRRH